MHDSLQSLAQRLTISLKLHCVIINYTAHVISTRVPDCTGGNQAASLYTKREHGLEITLPNTTKLLELIVQNTTKKEEINKSLRIYCWRGGMRSSAFAWLARTIGIKTYLLKGGYKNYS